MPRRSCLGEHIVGQVELARFQDVDFDAWRMVNPR
jgi:hypothetical protein